MYTSIKRFINKFLETTFQSRSNTRAKTYNLSAMIVRTVIKLLFCQVFPKLSTAELN